MFYYWIILPFPGKKIDPPDSDLAWRHSQSAYFTEMWVKKELNFFFFWWYGIRTLQLSYTKTWTQVFALSRQVLYHLIFTSSPFCSGHFGDRVLLLLRPAWPPVLLFMLPVEAGVTGMCHHALLFLLRWILVNFCPSWPGTAILSNSAYDYRWESPEPGSEL
jgi:hypothetical protein